MGKNFRNKPNKDRKRKNENSENYGPSGVRDHIWQQVEGMKMKDTKEYPRIDIFDDYDSYGEDE